MIRWLSIAAPSTLRPPLLLGAALVGTALLGCAPLAEMRPASGMMPGRSAEMGAGMVRLSPRQYVEESPANTGMMWFSADASRVVNLSVISAFDVNALALGLALRVNALKYDRFAGGVEAQAGYGWVALTLPFAARLFDQTWVYSSPRFGTLGRDLSFGAPVGLSVRVWNGFALRGEVQTSWQDFKYYNRRLHTALGVAYQW